MVIYSLIVINLPDITDVTLMSVISVLQQSDAVDPHAKILVLNIITIVFGSIMWILIALSLILKWKHSKLLAVMVSVDS